MSRTGLLSGGGLGLPLISDHPVISGNIRPSEDHVEYNHSLSSKGTVCDGSSNVTVMEAGPTKLTPEDEAFRKRKTELMG